MTYYAFDPTNSTYYAAAASSPVRSRSRRKSATRTTAAFNLFTRPSTTTKWTVFNDGWARTRFDLSHLHPGRGARGVELEAEQLFPAPIAVTLETSQRHGPTDESINSHR